MSSAVKELARDILVSRLASRAWRRGIADSAALFMFHRFEEPGADASGHRVALVREFLEEVRRRSYPILSLRDAVERASAGDPSLAGSLVFTIDDGYADAARVAAPLFAQFDAPVTTFAVTGFIDDEVWMWWDQVRYLVERAERRVVFLELGSERLECALGEDGRARSADLVINRLKGLPEAELRAGVAALAEAVDVPLPATAPEPYRPMSWEELNQAEGLGMEFGPHSVTHPILARATDAAAEIRGSWERLREQARNAVPVFCYPNGLPEDFGQREVDVVEGLGLAAAVASTPGYLRPISAGADLFRIPRFAFPEAMGQAIQVASGLENAVARG